MKLYRAVVENNKDPEELGKVQVRIHSIHSFSDVREFEGSNTSDLPWAEVIGGTDFGLIQGVGVSSVLQIGTLVWVLFEEDDPNKPTVLGTIKGSVGGNSDINKNARGKASGAVSVKNSSLNPLEGSQPASSYTYNQVIQSASGHMIELDDTPGGERVQIIDKNGNYSEMNLSSYIDKAVKDKINIVLGELKEHISGNASSQFDGNVSRTVNNSLIDHIMGNSTIDSDGNVNWTIGGNLTITVSGNAAITAAKIDLN